MKRLAWAGLLLLGVGNEVMAQPPPALRYLSYNVLHGGVLSGLTGDDEDLEARFRIAAEELRALDADIIGVQEASWSRGRGDVAERLARELGFHHVYAPALFRVTPADWFNRLVNWIMNFSEGPAVLSRFPIVASETLDLPRCNGFVDPRVLLHVTVRTPWGDLGVAATHTSRGFCEAEHVAALMQARRAPLPLVLMGDFNSGEESPGIRTLTGRAGFVDAFRAANPSAPGLTVWQAVHAPTPTVRRRVDYVFLLPGRVAPGRVRASRVVLDTPRRLEDGKILWPSDHYGVLAELEVFPSQPATARSGPASRWWPRSPPEQRRHRHRRRLHADLRPRGARAGPGPEGARVRGGDPGARRRRPAHRRPAHRAEPDLGPRGADEHRAVLGAADRGLALLPGALRPTARPLYQKALRHHGNRLPV